MLEGWGATLPLKPSTHGRGWKGKSWKEGGKARKGRKAMPCPALLNPNSLYTALVIL